MPSVGPLAQPVMTATQTAPSNIDLPTIDSPPNGNSSQIGQNVHSVNQERAIFARPRRTLKSA
jgi:hypothetical protein